MRQMGEKGGKAGGKKGGKARMAALTAEERKELARRRYKLDGRRPRRNANSLSVQPLSNTPESSLPGVGVALLSDP
jgi:hypothetical protein